MPIGTNLGNFIKAATAGLLNNVEKKEAPKANSNPPGIVAPSVVESEAEALLADPGADDQLALSSEFISEAGDEGVANSNQKSIGAQQEQLAEANAARVTAPVAPEQQLSEAQRPEAPLPTALSVGTLAQEQAQAQAPQLQELLQSWLQLDPRTIAGLQNFLQVEFSHFPEDSQIFMNVQMMRMLKQARQLIEEQKLRGVSVTEQEQTLPETPEGSQRAMIGASLAGYAYYKVLRRRTRLQDRLGVGIRIRGKDDEEISIPLVQNLREALSHLKEAEQNLAQAMAQGLNNDQIRVLVQKLLDVYTGIKEMESQLAPGNAKISA